MPSATPGIPKIRKEHSHAHSHSKHAPFENPGNIIALQFHWEVKPDNIRLLLKHIADDLGPGGFIQNPEEMLNQTEILIWEKIFWDNPQLFGSS